LSRHKGYDEPAFLAAHQSDQQITSIRLNRSKIPEQDLPISLQNIITDKVPWCTTGYYLSERPSFTLDPCFHAGAYYVQEASSMFVEQALLQHAALSKPLKVLDLCAAPGGKSTLLQSIISSESLLVSNEVIKTRVHVLSENISKWGSANVMVTNNDPQHFKRLENYFDIIVVDAPCSGSGLFRKDPTAINEWSENNVALCGQRQQRILADILPSLKAGGLLLYATCSYSAIENEDIADWLLASYPLTSKALKLEEEWGIIETLSPLKSAYGYRFYPNRVKGEGFF
jgi:16S rRNA C967 or C1407 C5-methylase (RsmB/RsmF family)